MAYRSRPFFFFFYCNVTKEHIHVPIYETHINLISLSRRLLKVITASFFRLLTPLTSVNIKSFYWFLFCTCSVQVIPWLWAISVLVRKHSLSTTTFFSLLCRELNYKKRQLNFTKIRPHDFRKWIPTKFRFQPNKFKCIQTDELVSAEITYNQLKYGVTNCF